MLVGWPESVLEVEQHQPPLGVRGVCLHLHQVLYVWSHKITACDVHDSDDAMLAALLISCACLRERISKRCRRQLILHADDSWTMRPATLVLRPEELRVLRSFSQPWVCNHNPFSELSLGTPNTGWTTPASL